MFAKKIREVEISNGAYNDFFKIYADTLDSDYSLLATLRALLHNRHENAEVYADLSTAGVRGYAQRTLDTRAVVQSMIRFPRNVSLTIRSMRGDMSDFEATFRMFDDPEDGFLRINPNFRRLNDVEAFIYAKGKFTTRVYVNELSKESFVLCEKLTLRTFHLIQSVIPRLMPWFFAEIPLSDDERELLHSLTYRHHDAYERIIAAITERINLRGYLIKSIVGDFEQSGRKEEISRTKETIRDRRAMITEYENRINAFMEELEDLNFRLIGQEIALESAKDSSDLVDYFCCNRNVTPVYVSGKSVTFTVKTHFSSFDPELYRTYINNEKSFMYNGYEFNSEFISPASRRKMLDAIFSDDPILKVNMCSNYTISLNGHVSAASRYEYGLEFKDYIPNPHINIFSCLGNYTRFIQSAINRGDLIGAIEQCIASAKSLNLTESHTTRYFLKDLFTSRNKVIQLPNGSCVTPAEALEYLNSLDAEKEENNV